MPGGNSDGLRIAGLGALTAFALGITAAGMRGVDSVASVPDVDGLKETAPGGGEWPFVSIIVPARNEERNLPILLPTLLDQHYPNYEVIVVDDQSDDATPRILQAWAERDSRLRVVRGEDLPRDQGWLGKPHAMHQGAEQAKGDWLLFTDADTRHEPLALSSCMANAMSHSVDLFSILPCQELVTPSERLIMPVSFQGIFFLYPIARVNDPASDIAIANGQYLLIRRSVYDAVGGAERVKGQIVEDLEFAKAVKRDGFRLYMADGRHLVSVRMYTGLSEIWEGWGKNTIIALRDNPGLVPLSVFGLFAGLGLPILLLRWAGQALNKLRVGRPGDRLAASTILALVTVDLAAYVAARRRVDRVFGLPFGWSLTQPVGGAVFALLMLNSIFRLATGRGVVWKGRTYHDGQGK